MPPNSLGFGKPINSTSLSVLKPPVVHPGGVCFLGLWVTGVSPRRHGRVMRGWLSRLAASSLRWLRTLALGPRLFARPLFLAQSIRLMKTAARHRIITSEQIISARQLLGWTKTKLAQQSNISPLSVSNLEDPTALSKSKPKTLVAVRTAFEDAGIVFDHDGVRKRAG